MASADRVGRRLQQPFDEPRRQYAGRQRPLARAFQGGGAVPAGQADDAAGRPHPLFDVAAAVDQTVDVGRRGHADRRRLGAQALGRALHDGAMAWRHVLRPRRVSALDRAVRWLATRSPR